MRAARSPINFFALRKTADDDIKETADDETEEEGKEQDDEIHSSVYYRGFIRLTMGGKSQIQIFNDQ